MLFEPALLERDRRRLGREPNVGKSFMTDGLSSLERAYRSRLVMTVTPPETMISRLKTGRAIPVRSMFDKLSELRSRSMTARETTGNSTWVCSELFVKGNQIQ